LSGNIINKNLKLLVITYLARKVDILFHFPTRSQYTWDRTYGRTVYINISVGSVNITRLTFSRERRTANIVSVTWHKRFTKAFFTF